MQSMSATMSEPFFQGGYLADNPGHKHNFIPAILEVIAMLLHNSVRISA